jgi:hypothetical protein
LERVDVVDRNGHRPATREGTNGVNNKERQEERKRKDRELLEKATEIAIEMYAPALKELEKH